MTREDIIRMAREAGFDPHDMSDDFTCNLVDIERFAALVTAAARAEQWVGLTDEEIAEVISGQFAERNYWVKITKALESKLKEKNA